MCSRRLPSGPSRDVTGAGSKSPADAGNRDTAAPAGASIVIERASRCLRAVESGCLAGKPAEGGGAQFGQPRFVRKAFAQLDPQWFRRTVCRSTGR